MLASEAEERDEKIMSEGSDDERERSRSPPSKHDRRRAHDRKKSPRTAAIYSSSSSEDESQDEDESADDVSVVDSDASRRECVQHERTRQSTTVLVHSLHFSCVLQERLVRQRRRR